MAISWGCVGENERERGCFGSDISWAVTLFPVCRFGGAGAVKCSYSDAVWRMRWGDEQVDMNAASGASRYWSVLHECGLSIQNSSVWWELAMENHALLPFHISALSHRDNEIRKLRLLLKIMYFFIKMTVLWLLQTKMSLSVPIQPNAVEVGAGRLVLRKICHLW